MRPGSRVLITGEAGSCGRYVTTWLFARGHAVRVIDKNGGPLGLLEGHDGKRRKETLAVKGDLECGIWVG